VGSPGGDAFGQLVRPRLSPADLVYLLGFDAHAFRTEDYEGVKDFARGCMRTYLILKEKAQRFNADAEIQELLAEINADDGTTDEFEGPYSAGKAEALKAAAFHRAGLGERGLAYERLDQLTMELLLGVR
jgi:xylose isomerase